MLISSKPIITIKEARKLLGKDSKDLSDSEIKTMINDYELLIRQAIKKYLVRN